MTYYQYINGVRYARDLIAQAEESILAAENNRLSQLAVQELYQSAEDGRRITDTERRTLWYILENRSLTPEAREWLGRRLQLSSDSGFQQRIGRILREEYQLKNLQWEIAEEEAKKQEALGFPRLFESAFRGALDAFLTRNIGQLSLAAFVNRQAFDVVLGPTPEQLLKSYLDRGTLYLVPTTASLPVDLPPEFDLDSNWLFVLRIPEFEPVLFSAQVSRAQNIQSSRGYISTKPALEERIEAVLKRFTNLPGLRWQINAEEVERQLELQSNQNFGNGLFSAMHTGIYNGESSLSFRDFIRDEIWPDPERHLNEYIQEYVNTGTLHLIPMDYRKQTERGTAAFPIPDMFSFWFAQDWIFGLEMPEKTHIRVLINVPRDDQNGEFGWNDGFIPEGETVEEVLERVKAREFNSPELNLIFSEREYRAQAQQFGPDWRNAPSLVRQTLNSILHDYVEPRSVFNQTAAKHAADIKPEHFETLRQYREAVSQQVRIYLQKATLEFLPIELPDNNPIDGEPIEDFWQFFAILPDLSRFGFWVIIPRWPNDEQLPYVYNEG